MIDFRFPGAGSPINYAEAMRFQRPQPRPGQQGRVIQRAAKPMQPWEEALAGIGRGASQVAGQMHQSNMQDRSIAAQEAMQQKGIDARYDQIVMQSEDQQKLAEFHEAQANERFEKEQAFQKKQFNAQAWNSTLGTLASQVAEGIPVTQEQLQIAAKQGQAVLRDQTQEMPKTVNDIIGFMAKKIKFGPKQKSAPTARTPASQGVAPGAPPPKQLAPGELENPYENVLSKEERADHAFRQRELFKIGIKAWDPEEQRKELDRTLKLATDAAKDVLSKGELEGMEGAMAGVNPEATIQEFFDMLTDPVRENELQRRIDQGLDLRTMWSMIQNRLKDSESLYKPTHTQLFDKNYPFSGKDKEKYSKGKPMDRKEAEERIRAEISQVEVKLAEKRKKMQEESARYALGQTVESNARTYTAEQTTSKPATPVAVSDKKISNIRAFNGQPIADAPEDADGVKYVTQTADGQWFYLDKESAARVFAAEDQATKKATNPQESFKSVYGVGL